MKDDFTLIESNIVVSKWEKEEHLVENQSFFAVWDSYPVNKGHTLIIAKSEVVTLFDLSRDEFTDLYEILQQIRYFLDKQFHPDGYNIGANCGSEAGQTVFRLHIHVIPRYKNDVDNPRGGIRNIKPPLVSY